MKIFVAIEIDDYAYLKALDWVKPRTFIPFEGFQVNVMEQTPLPPCYQPPKCMGCRRAWEQSGLEVSFTSANWGDPNSLVCICWLQHT